MRRKATAAAASSSLERSTTMAKTTILMISFFFISFLLRNVSQNSLSGLGGNCYEDHLLYSWKGISSTGSSALFMDLSNNNFTGDLPTSFQDLKNITALASKSTASSMHVHPLFLVVCFLLCFLLLNQPQPQLVEQKLPEQLVLCFLLCFLLQLKQPQPQPPEEEVIVIEQKLPAQPQPLEEEVVVEQKLPAQLSLDHNEDDTDGSYEDTDGGSEDLEEEGEHYYPDGDEYQFLEKDPRGVWKRERGGRHHWKKKFNYHH